MFHSLDHHLVGTNRARRWLRSGRCTSGHCYEWLTTHEATLLRDSKTAHLQPQPVIPMDHETWADFARLLANHVDVDTAAMYQVGPVSVAVRHDRWIDVTHIESGTTLSFNEQETASFAAGILSGDTVSVA